PFRMRAAGAGGQAVTGPAKLLGLTATGRLKVRQKSGKPLDAIVDGVGLGQTPWEGTLAAGDHMVLLRGDGTLGTAPVSARVKAKELTTLSLRAEELDTLLRVDPTPAGAIVSIDSVPVGRGIWEGALRSGAHLVEVRAEGFLAVKRQIRLGVGQQEQLAIALERDADAEIWRKP